MNISSDEQVLQEYRSNRAEMAISHFSRYRPSQDGLVQPLMGLGDEPHFTFANGWMWALTDANPDNRQISLELAEYLVEEDFLEPWVEEAGYLPTRRFPISEESDTAVASIVEASQLTPSADTLQVLGPLMQGAILRVLNGEEPETVARSVVDELR
jgi:ABC-type glycerol-3-phosphate transport system substrate-binding protein